MMQNWTGDMVQVVETLPSKFRALSSNSSMTKNAEHSPFKKIIFKILRDSRIHITWVYDKLYSFQSFSMLYLL
jgi:hypothetical protein